MEIKSAKLKGLEEYSPTFQDAVEKYLIESDERILKEIDKHQKRVIIRFKV